MNTLRVAAGLALLIGALSIVAGGMAMRGWNPGWSVLKWLPVYNFVMGILSLIPAVLLWINHPYAMTASLTVFGTHAVVLLLLLSIFRGKVARQSIRAMAFRVATWLLILVLFWI